MLAFVAYEHWPKAPLDPKDPSTWPVTERRAVILASDQGEHCPPSRLAWQFEGTKWREAGTWRGSSGPAGDNASESGILCLRAVRDLGILSKIGQGAEETTNSAIFAAVIEKDGGCPAGTNYEAGDYCLKSTRLPPAPDIAP
ncbi:MAG TPA: hypothetical protein VIG52_11465 [Methyloceanibacter sp.]